MHRPVSYHKYSLESLLILDTSQSQSFSSVLISGCDGNVCPFPSHVSYGKLGPGFCFLQNENAICYLSVGF